MADSEFHAVVESLMRPPPGDSGSAADVGTVAVLGAGPLGQLLACAFLAEESRVRLYSAYGGELAALRASGGITVRGAALTGTYAVSDTAPRTPAIELAPAIDTAVADADLVLVATPAYAHEIHAGLLAGRLRDGQAVMLTPGRFLGSIGFARVLRRHLAPATTIAELDTPPYLVSGEPGRLTVHDVARRVGCASLHGDDSERLAAGLRPVLPGVSARDSVLETAFDGVSALLYAVPVLLAAAEVERAHHDGRTVLLRDLITPGVANSVISRADEERRRTAFAYGVRDTLGVAEQVAATFGGDGDNLSDVVRDSEAFDELAVPAGSHGGPHVADEVPHSLVPLASAATAVGIPTPATDSLIGLASALVGVDFAREGRTLATIGLDGQSPDALRRLLGTGTVTRSDALWQVS